MNLDPFITFKSGDKLCILQTQMPHYVGLISESKESLFHTVQIPLHYLFISFKGNLEGNFMLMHSDEVKNIQNIFDQMALFYFEHRIQKFPDRFKKYKI